MRVAPVTPVRQHEGQPRSAQHPARRGAALCGGARPRNLRNLVGLPGRGGRQQRPARFPGLGDCHAARGSWRLWAAVGCAYGASRVLGSVGGLPWVPRLALPQPGQGLLGRAGTRWPWAPGHVCGTDCGQFASERDCPTWAALTDNVPAPGSAGEARPGDWPHGWQFHASRTRTNCRPWNQPTGPCCFPSPANKRLPGLQQCLRTRPPRSRPK